VNPADTRTVRRVVDVKKVPTEAAANPSFAFAFRFPSPPVLLGVIRMTVDGVTYAKVLTYGDTDTQPVLTAISAWNAL